MSEAHRKWQTPDPNPTGLVPESPLHSTDLQTATLSKSWDYIPAKCEVSEMVVGKVKEERGIIVLM